MARDRGTRERILDVALELFTEDGYDRASLREIAERLGVTKAALYYHFPSKADILFALHLRLHALIDEPLEQLREGPVTLERWETFLSACMDKLEGNTALFLLHRNNQAAFSGLHNEAHRHAHTELEQWANKLFSDPSLSPGERLKMAASFAVAFLTPMLAAPLTSPGDEADTAPALRRIIHGVLRMPTEEAANTAGNGSEPRRRAAGGPPAGDRAAGGPPAEDRAAGGPPAGDRAGN